MATSPRSAQQQPVLGTTSPYSPLRCTARGHDFCFCIMQILANPTKGSRWAPRLRLTERIFNIKLLIKLLWLGLSSVMKASKWDMLTSQECTPSARGALPCTPRQTIVPRCLCVIEERVLASSGRHRDCVVSCIACRGPAASEWETETFSSQPADHR